MRRPGLAVTVHDPEGRWLARFAPALSDLARLYAGMVATCTGGTGEPTAAALRSAGFRVLRTVTGSRVGENRRAAMRALLDASDAPWLQYADLDRLLHWERAHPEELRALLATPPDGAYVALGRTARAWRTHPLVQRHAERLTNDALNAALRLRPPGDFTAGSCLVSRRAAEVIVALSQERANGTDLEWPALVYRALGEAPACIRTEGLEFETADYFEDQIERAGSRAAWVRQVYDRPAAWLERAEIARQSIAALDRVLSAPAGA